MKNTIEKIRNCAIVPVVKIDNAKDAVPLANALKRGGLLCAEITFRTDAAEEAIRRIRSECEDFLVGAGTVLTTDQADRAWNAGAEFMVSPGLNPQVVRHCIEKGYPIVPGVCTPSDVEAGLALGLSYLKFFPAEAAGGVKMIKALSAPYNQVQFMPTGGISAGNLREYLTCSSVFACGGSWMVPADLINEGKFDEIANRTAQAVALVKEIKSL